MLGISFLFYGLFLRLVKALQGSVYCHELYITLAPSSLECLFTYLSTRLGLREQTGSYTSRGDLT